MGDGAVEPAMPARSECTMAASIADALRQHDFRHGTVQISPAGTELGIPAVHTGASSPPTRPTRCSMRSPVPGTRIVTLTVTEHGYTYSPATHRLTVDSPAVAADLAGGSPVTTIGQIVRGLQRRIRTGDAPITVLSCDNRTGNGDPPAGWSASSSRGCPPPKGRIWRLIWLHR